jgi:hypothetical protein
VVVCRDNLSDGLFWALMFEGLTDLASFEASARREALKLKDKLQHNVTCCS